MRSDTIIDAGVVLAMFAFALVCEVLGAPAVDEAAAGAAPVREMPAICDTLPSGDVAGCTIQ